MCKQEFLEKLRKKLTGMPQRDIEDRIVFYTEMIDDRIEEGLKEEDAIAELGSLDHITIQIMSEIPLAKFVKEKVRANRPLHTWELVLLIAGSPIWLSLLIAFFSIVISIYAVIWSLIISIWAIEFSLAACALAGVLGSVVFAVQGHIASTMALLGAAFLCAGVAIFGLYGCRCATNGVLKLTKRICIWMKICFVKKEVAE